MNSGSLSFCSFLLALLLLYDKLKYSFHNLDSTASQCDIPIVPVAGRKQKRRVEQETKKGKIETPTHTMPSQAVIHLWLPPIPIREFCEFEMTLKGEEKERKVTPTLLKL
jgi:hypothetical protein